MGSENNGFLLAILATTFIDFEGMYKADPVVGKRRSTILARISIQNMRMWICTNALQEPFQDESQP